MTITNFPPHSYEWMLFVDGENLAIRARALTESLGMTLLSGPHYMKDVYIWFSGGQRGSSREHIDAGRLNLRPHSLRSYYYTSVQGDDARIRTVRQSLADLSFTPVVFKKPARQQKAKGVDIQLTIDLLTNAFRDNFQVAVLIAGDADYVPIVKEVQRLGKLVSLAFLREEGVSGLSSELKLACDAFVDITNSIVERNSVRAENS